MTTVITITAPSTYTMLGGPLPTVGQQSQAPVILADYYNPGTRDFASMMSTLDHIDAQAVIAITTKRGSGPAVENVGNNLHKIKKITDSIETDIKSEIKTAFKRLTDNGDVTLKPITFETDKSNQQVEFVVSWVNNRSGTLASVRALLETT